MSGHMRRLLLLVSAIVFTDTMFFAAITPLLPTYVDDFGLSKSAAGVLAAAYPAGTFIGALPGGWIAARFGVRRTVQLGLAGLIVSSVAFAFAPSIAVLDIARFVQGVAGAATWAGAIGWLMAAAPSERRGELIGSAMAAAIVGVIFGPVLGGIAVAVGPEAGFSAVAVLGIGLFAWTLTMPAAPLASRTRFRELFAVLGEGRVVTGMWLVTLTGLLFGTLSVLVPLRLDVLGASAAVIAGAFLGAAVLEAIVSPAMGRLSDRRGRVLPIMIGLAAAVVVMLVIPWPQTAWLLVFLVILASPAVGVLWAPSMAMLSDGAESRGIDQAFAFGLVNLAWATGETGGAAGGARLGEVFSDAFAYLLLAALCIVTFVAVRRARTLELVSPRPTASSSHPREPAAASGSGSHAGP
jgi:MFS family permease